MDIQLHHLSDADKEAFVEGFAAAATASASIGRASLMVCHSSSFASISLALRLALSFLLNASPEKNVSMQPFRPQ